MVVLVAISLSPSKLAEIEHEIELLVRKLPRGDIVVKALANSYVIQFDSVSAAMQFTNDYAPEHLILYTRESAPLVDMVQNAGSVFVGPWSPVSCGDYASGTNHVRCSGVCADVDSPDVRVREDVQRGQHAEFPETYNGTRTHRRGNPLAGSHGHSSSRSRRPRCTRRECPCTTPRIGLDKVDFHRLHCLGNVYLSFKKSLSLVSIGLSAPSCDPTPRKNLFAVSHSMVITRCNTGRGTHFTTPSRVPRIQSTDLTSIKNSFSLTTFSAALFRLALFVQLGMLQKRLLQSLIISVRENRRPRSGRSGIQR
jgi:Histidinol dehydrogenase